MKKIIIAFIVLLVSNTLKADIVKAQVLATGLTCSLCSKATFKQLNTIAEIDKIDVDVNNTSFILYFKKGTNINPALIKQKIEAAGFSVGNLELTVETNVINNQFTLGSNIFTIINSDKKSLSKSFQVKVLNQGFVTTKEYKNLVKAKPQIAFSTKLANTFFVELI